jgi:DNA-binding IclR family transcriptional regulator
MHVAEYQAEEQRGTTGVQVLARAAEILRALAASPGGLSQAELADKLGLARTTVHRILGALEEESLVTVARSRGRYRLGAEIGRMAEAVRRERVATLHPLLEQLSRGLDETVDLSVLDGRRVTFVDQVVALRRLRAVSAVGESFPLHSCAPGKAILATLPVRELRSMVAGHLNGLTPSTITTMAALRAELARVKSEGVAYDREEHTVGICAVAVVLDPTDPHPMAISVPVPAQRFHDREMELRSALLELRRRIVDELSVSA